MFSEKVANLQSQHSSASSVMTKSGSSLQDQSDASASSMVATKIILANYEEQKKLYGKFTEVDDHSSNADTEDFYSCKDKQSHVHSQSTASINSWAFALPDSRTLYQVKDSGTTIDHCSHAELDADQEEKKTTLGKKVVRF